MDLKALLRHWTRRDQLEAELEEEFQLHVDLRARQLESAGSTPSEARAEARRQFGNRTSLKEESRMLWTTRWIEESAQDFRYALRTLQRSPSFTVAAVLTLALGLGLQTALFTVFNGTVLRPFAVRDPFSLFQVSWQTQRESKFSFTLPEFQSLRQQTQVFSDAAAIEPRFNANVDGQGMLGSAVSDNYFELLGGATILGRPLERGDHDALVLSHQAWRERFASDPRILGRKILVNGHPFEVIGVTTPEFVDPISFKFALFDLQVGFWMNVDSLPLIWDKHPPSVSVLVRVKPELTREQAQSALLAYAAHITSERVVTATLESRATRLDLRPQSIWRFIPLVLVFGLVLVIACANVANMMLARGIARQREVGIRISLGASRARVLRQLLTEGLVISLFAGALGMLFAEVALWGTTNALSSFWAQNAPKYFGSPKIVPFVLDYRAFIFVLIIATLVTLAFAWIPAWQSTRQAASHSIRGEAAGLRPGRLRDLLLAAQIAVCLLLLVCSATLLRSTSRLEGFDPGFNPAGIFRVQASREALPELIRILQRQPWIEPLALSARAPLDGFRALPMNITGKSSEPIAFNLVSPSYFPLLRIPLTKGRAFNESEALAKQPVAIVSESAAQHWWPSQDPIGQIVHLNLTNRPSWIAAPEFSDARVIGVVKDVAHRVSAGRAVVYFPIDPQGKQGGTLLVRGKVDPQTTARLGKQAIGDVFWKFATPGSMPLDPFAPVAAELDMQLAPFHAASAISTVLGILALLLTASGIFGVVSYIVSQRTREIGIRMALGASAFNVAKLVLKQSLKRALFGALAGIPLAYAASALFAAVVPVVNGFDPLAYAAAIGVVLSAAILAAFGPAQRAAHTRPGDTLRAD